MSVAARLAALPAQELPSDPMSKKHLYVLGINAYDHDVSACLLRDGEIAFAINKERITRKQSPLPCNLRQGRDGSLSSMTSGTSCDTMRISRSSTGRT